MGRFLAEHHSTATDFPAGMKCGSQQLAILLQREAC